MKNVTVANMVRTRKAARSLRMGERKIPKNVTSYLFEISNSIKLFYKIYKHSFPPYFKMCYYRKVRQWGFLLKYMVKDRTKSFCFSVMAL